MPIVEAELPLNVSYTPYFHRFGFKTVMFDFSNSFILLVPVLIRDMSSWDLEKSFCFLFEHMQICYQCYLYTTERFKRCMANPLFTFVKHLSHEVDKWQEKKLSCTQSWGSIDVCFSLKGDIY